MKTRDMVMCAMMAAVICVCSAISFPVGEISVTLAVLGVLLTAVALGWKRGTAAAAVFILLGAAGLPVFSNMRGGIGMLIGPTGGYIYSYILMTVITGFAADRLCGVKNRAVKFGGVFLACIISVAVCYALGTVQFMAVTGRSLPESAAVCVVPFIPFDAAKSVPAVILGFKLRSIIKL